MRTRRLALFALAISCAPASARAEELSLRSRLRPGDSYRLSLSVLTQTEASARGPGAESFDETVRLQYRAGVTVLEVDAEERPVREQHRGVSLTFERPGDSGPLFQEPVSFEVRRKERLEIFAGNERLDARLEKPMADVLEKQFEYTLEPALVDPGRAVEVGESWAPSEDLARRFLLSRGVRVLAFGDGAVATLRRAPGNDGTTGLVVDYSIPIARLELLRMPDHAEAARSEGVLDGQIRLASEPGTPPVSTKSSLTLDLSGLSRTAAQSMPWSLRSSVTVERTTSPAGDLATSGPR